MSDPRDAIFDVSQHKGQLGAAIGRSARAVLVVALLKVMMALVTTGVLARLVPPAEQGLVALAMPAVLLATGLSEFGLAHAVVQRPHVTHNLVSTLFWVNVALGLFLATGVVLLGFPAAWFYEQPGVTPVFFGLAPYILFTVLDTQYVAILRRQMRIRRIETCSLAATILGSLLAIAVAWAGAGYWALVVQLVMAEFFNMVFLVASARWLPSGPLKIDLKASAEALRFGSFLAAERLLTEFSREMQIIVIGRAFGAVEAGLFYRSQTIAQMPSRRITTPLSGAFLPALARLQDDPAGFRAMYRRQVSRANLIMVPIGLLICSCADIMVRIMLGRDWAATTPILAWLGLLPMTALTLSSFSWALVACGHSRALFRFRVLGASLMFLALLAGVWVGLMGLVGAYVITLVFIQGPILASVALRYTPLTLTTLRQTLLGEAIFAGGMLLLLLGLRRILDLQPMILEGFAAGLVLLLSYGLRLAFDPVLRQDVGKVLGRSRLPAPRRPA